jgi:hypothetical protein
MQEVEVVVLVLAQQFLKHLLVAKEEEDKVEANLVTLLVNPDQMVRVEVQVEVEKIVVQLVHQGAQE